MYLNFTKYYLFLNTPLLWNENMSVRFFFNSYLTKLILFFKTYLFNSNVLNEREYNSDYCFEVLKKVQNFAKNTVHLISYVWKPLINFQKFEHLKFFALNKSSHFLIKTNFTRRKRKKNQTIWYIQGIFLRGKLRNK